MAAPPADVAAPEDEMSGTSGIGRSCTMPWLAGGDAGSPESPLAANSGKMQSSAIKRPSDVGMTRLPLVGLSHSPRVTTPSHRPP